jgi:hypothetical protein
MRGWRSEAVVALSTVRGIVAICRASAIGCHARVGKARVPARPVGGFDRAGGLGFQQIAIGIVQRQPCGVNWRLQNDTWQTKVIAAGCQGEHAADENQVG